MNDLSGLSWDSKPLSASTSKPPTTQYASSRLSPLPAPSRETTPAPAQQGKQNGFASLLSPSQAAKAAGSVSMQERQKQLMEEKARQAIAQQQAAAHDASFWDGLGSGTSRSSTPHIQVPAPVEEDEDDILAAFNSAAPVDKSSHFPPPSHSSTSREPSRSSSTFASRGASPLPTSQPIDGQLENNDDEDDPFGLGQMASKPTQPAASVTSHRRQPTADDDDILGLLGKPVEESRRRPDESPPRQRPTRSDKYSSDDENITQNTSSQPQDRAVAELVDMGFPADKAKDALQQTDTGTNVQAAVSVLLNQAHEEARSRSRNDPSRNGQLRNDSPAQPSRGRATGKQTTIRDDSSGSVPAWMRKDGASEPTSRQESPGASREKDVAQYAQKVGSSLFKSANTLWKTGQKKVQKAYAEYQHEASDSGKPRWMQESRSQEDDAPAQPARPARATDEAMMLEMQGPPPERRRRPVAEQEQRAPARRPSPDAPSFPTRPRHDPPPPSQSRPREKLSRQAVEEQSAQAYVSSARRRKPAQTTTPPVPTTTSPSTASSLDIFSDTTAPPSRPKQSSSPQPPRAAPTPIAPRSAAPPRTIPPVSQSALDKSHTQRNSGTAAFKRGDYAEAHALYASSLSAIPASHPVAIILLCNRALTGIKTGEPKAAIADADKALAAIGPARGEGEAISLGAEGEKPMREFYGKALARKAEALEALEKWSDAASVWKQAVESGVGGPLAIQGRNRCEKAAAPARPAVAAVKKAAPPRPKAGAALGGLNGAGGETEAVRRLRAQNAAAAAASDEAFALTDAVNARLVAWKGTKSDNLRALLASLDTVLWPSAGWKKIGMGDLVMPNKVKIHYMKAIAKVHPDKIPQDATTEQKMISGAVFATLNEAWDKFKKDNGL